MGKRPVKPKKGDEVVSKGKSHTRFPVSSGEEHREAGDKNGKGAGSTAGKKKFGGKGKFQGMKKKKKDTDTVTVAADEDVTVEVDTKTVTGESNWERLRSTLTQVHVQKKRQRVAALGKDPTQVGNSTHAPRKRPKLKVKSVSRSGEGDGDSADDSAGSLNGDPAVLEGKDKGGRLSNVVAMDCEMVGVGPDGSTSALARVSIVNYEGDVILDTYCRPRERVTDFRTFVSGIRPKHLFSAPNLRTVQDQVARILTGRIVVGHALKNDFSALMLSHPKRDVRDTAKYKPLRNHGRPQALRKLARSILGVAIQEGQHSSVIDARATMAIYKKHAKTWEQTLKGQGGKSKKKKVAKAKAENI